MTPIRTLILDFDGVIVESNDLKTHAFARVFARFPEHFDTMMAFHEAHVSASRFEKFRYLVTTLLGRSAGDPLVDVLAEDFSQQTVKLVADCPLVTGATGFLDTVSARVPVYLASVTPQADLETILRLRRLSGYFAGVYGCPPWTKVRAIEDILAGSGPEGVLFIGDSAGDQRAALATGVEFLARDSGLKFDDPQPSSEPDMGRILMRVAPRLFPERSVV